MADRIFQSKLRIGGIIRTNVFNAHNVMFGVYGDIIYHHACGSRAIIGRPKNTAGASANNSRQCYTGVDLYSRSKIGDWLEEDFEKECADIIKTNTQIFDIIYNNLLMDKECNFVRRYFLGIP